MTIAGTLVRAGCAAARLPLDLAEGQLLGERRADWPPVLIFDTVESGIKQLVGSLTRDATLVQEGRLERAKVAELREAVELETVAESRREAADAEHEARLEADEDRRRQVEDRKVEQQRAAERTARREATARRDRDRAQACRCCTRGKRRAGCRRTHRTRRSRRTHQGREGSDREEAPRHRGEETGESRRRPATSRKGEPKGDDEVDDAQGVHYGSDHGATTHRPLRKLRSSPPRSAARRGTRNIFSCSAAMVSRLARAARSLPPFGATQTRSR